MARSIRTGPSPSQGGTRRSYRLTIEGFWCIPVRAGRCSDFRAYTCYRRAIPMRLARSAALSKGTDDPRASGGVQRVRAETHVSGGGSPCARGGFFHPRFCAPIAGRSPWVRGNLATRRLSGCSRRVDPSASAEPRLAISTRRSVSDDPRARGATHGEIEISNPEAGSSPPTRGGPAQLTTSCMLLAGFIVSRSRARGGRLAHGGQARRTKDGATLTFPEIPRRPLRRYGKRRRVWKRRLGRRTTRATHPGAQPAPSRRSSPGAPRRGSTSRAPPSTPGRSSFCPGSRHRGIGIPTQRRYSHPRSRKAARLTPGGAYQPLAA